MDSAIPFRNLVPALDGIHFCRVGQSNISFLRSYLYVCGASVHRWIPYVSVNWPIAFDNAGIGGDGSWRCAVDGRVVPPSTPVVAGDNGSIGDTCPVYLA